MNETSAPPVVRVRDLRKSYGGAVAVDGISFDILEGETFALLGPNGAGKSTTIEILEGYRDRTSGGTAVALVQVAHTHDRWSGCLVHSPSLSAGDSAVKPPVGGVRHPPIGGCLTLAPSDLKKP